MKLWTVIFIVILMIGITPAFAVDSPVSQQNTASKAVKQIDTGIKNVSQITGAANDNVVTSLEASDLENSGYIDEYDDDGNYIGNYIWVDSSDLSDTSDDELDEIDDYSVSSFNIPGEYTDYLDEPDNVDTANFEDIDEFNEVNGDVSSEIVNMADGDVSAGLSDENDNLNELNADDQFDGDGYDIFTGLEIEFEDNVDELNENDDVDELDDGNCVVFDPSDFPSSEDTSYIDTNVSTNCKPLIVTIVNGLCGVVQATLRGLGNVCMICGNTLETIF